MTIYSQKDMTDTISMLLLLLDKYDDTLHFAGQTPDWYVAAASVTCAIENKTEVMKTINETIIELKNDPRKFEKISITIETSA